MKPLIGNPKEPRAMRFRSPLHQALFLRAYELWECGCENRHLTWSEVAVKVGFPPEYDHTAWDFWKKERVTVKVKLYSDVVGYVVQRFCIGSEMPYPRRQKHTA